MKKYLFLLIAAVLAFSLAAERKALIIGNSAYIEKRLANPVNDARDLEAKLKSLGFKTTLKTDLDKEQFETSIDNFAKSLSSSDEAIFYFAGHGVQVENVNYLIPIKANIEEEYHCKHRAVNTGYILDALEKSKISIIILDACRNNPYSWRRSGSRGLAPMDVESGGQYVIYSTSAGSEAHDGDGKNSPFAASLINHIATADLPLDDLIRSIGKDLSKYKQKPQVYGFLGEEYYFVRSDDSQPVEQKRTTPPIEVKSSAPVNMVYVEGGSFQMGSNDGDNDEKPVHQVTVSSFYIGKYEVTQKEWQEVMGSNPSKWKETICL